MDNDCKELLLRACRISKHVDQIEADGTQRTRTLVYELNEVYMDARKLCVKQSHGLDPVVKPFETATELKDCIAESRVLTQRIYPNASDFASKYAVRLDGTLNWLSNQ